MFPWCSVLETAVVAARVHEPLAYSSVIANGPSTPALPRIKTRPSATRAADAPVRDAFIAGACTQLPVIDCCAWRAKGRRTGCPVAGFSVSTLRKRGTRCNVAPLQAQLQFPRL